MQVWCEKQCSKLVRRRIACFRLVQLGISVTVFILLARAYLVVFKQYIVFGTTAAIG